MTAKLTLSLFTFAVLPFVALTRPDVQQAVLFPSDRHEGPALPLFFPGELIAYEAYAAAVDECSNLGPEMPYKTRDENEYACYPLLSQGPCEADEWFVMDEKVSFFGLDMAVCQKRPCGGNVILIPVEGQAKCGVIGSSQKCGHGMEILPNPFGKGECGCQINHLPHIDEKGHLQCYNEFLQGPCREGQQFIQPPQPDSDPMCVPTDCPKDHVRYRNSECILVKKCQQNEIIVFNWKQDTTECVNESNISEIFNIRQLIDLPTVCPPGEQLDFNNQCRKATRKGNKQVRRMALGARKNLRSFLRNRRRNRE